ncbi:MAG TPA: hypothetical protein VMS77_00890 [Conexivisphaerales archaeon]|nr:hypothetical protein [Conexivisphaerales archaeon]
MATLAHASGVRTGRRARKSEKRQRELARRKLCEKLADEEFNSALHLLRKACKSPRYALR